jgi:hypothetical protein
MATTLNAILLVRMLRISYMTFGFVIFQFVREIYWACADANPLIFVEYLEGVRFYVEFWRDYIAELR